MAAMAAVGDRSLMSPDNRKQSNDAALHSPQSVLDLVLYDAPKTKTTSDHDPSGHGHAAHPTLGTYRPNRKNGWGVFAFGILSSNSAGKLLEYISCALSRDYRSPIPRTAVRSEISFLRFPPRLCTRTQSLSVRAATECIQVLVDIDFVGLHQRRCR